MLLPKNSPGSIKNVGAECDGRCFSESASFVDSLNLLGKVLIVVGACSVNGNARQ